MTITETLDSESGKIDDLIYELKRFKCAAEKKHPSASEFRWEVIKEEQQYQYETSYTIVRLRLSYERNMTEGELRQQQEQHAKNLRLRQLAEQQQFEELKKKYGQ